MSSLKRFHILTPLITLGVLSIFLLQPGHNAALTFRFDRWAFIERGDRVEKRYETYSKRLASHHAALIHAVQNNAPDLLASLQPREPILYGYQILPQILPAPLVDQREATHPVAYSWPWTDRLIDHELRNIIDSESELRRVTDIGFIERKATLERLAQNYQQLRRQLQNIHAHVQYNRVWQAAIASDRTGYDRETALYSAVVERRKLIDGLARLDTRVGTSRASLRGPLRRVDVIASLRRREALLARRIDLALSRMQVPAFVKRQKFNNHWRFRVPLFTDIEDQKYVTAVKEVIESMWQLKDGKDRFTVELELTYIPTAALYADGDKPNAGERIEVRRHLARFPTGSAILTTGARTTHVQGDAIVLGPHPIVPGVLAHEFGHILGFRDRYVRGYKDLGEHGFQVMEIVADQEDIMAATAGGVVQRRHFLRLLEHGVGFDSQLESPSSEPTNQSSIQRQTIGGSRWNQTKRDPPKSA